VTSECHLTFCTENATPPKSTKSRDSNPSVHISFRPKSLFEFVPRDTEKSEVLDLVECGGVAIVFGSYEDISMMMMMNHTGPAYEDISLMMNHHTHTHIIYIYYMCMYHHTHMKIHR